MIEGKSSGEPAENRAAGRRAWLARGSSALWWGGIALIAGSWLGVVTPTVGWVGFGLTGVAALGLKFMPRDRASGEPDGTDRVALNSRHLSTRGAAYHDVMHRFTEGAALFHDGVGFFLRGEYAPPDHWVACGVPADAAEVSDAAALAAADYAGTVFDRLLAISPEFAAAVAGRERVVSVWADGDNGAVECCRVVGGEIEWLS